MNCQVYGIQGPTGLAEEIFNCQEGLRSRGLLISQSFS